MKRRTIINSNSRCKWPVECNPLDSNLNLLPHVYNENDGASHGLRGQMGLESISKICSGVVAKCYERYVRCRRNSAVERRPPHHRNSILGPKPDAIFRIVLETDAIGLV